MIKMGGVPVDGSVRKFRRIVTGHNSNGESVILSDDLCPHSRAIMGVPTFAGTLLWVTKETPVDNSTDPGDPAAEEIGVAPPLTGSILRVVEFAPDVTWQSKHNLKVMMHRTASLDYAIVLQGEIFAVLDKSETLMKPGDVLIQRGTNHAWANCSNAPSIVLFVLIGAEAISGLSSQV